MSAGLRRAVGALETIIGTLLEDTVYTAKVASMIADIGKPGHRPRSALQRDERAWGDDGFDDGLHHAADASCKGSRQPRWNYLIRRFGGAFHTDERTGRTTSRRPGGTWRMVPAVATPLSQLLAGGEARRAHRGEAIRRLLVMAAVAILALYTVVQAIQPARSLAIIETYRARFIDVRPPRQQ